MEILATENWQQFGKALTKGDPDIIVAIARKMPRVLERTGLTSICPCPVVSDRALPWTLPTLHAAASIVFSDDVVNAGTTVSHYAQYARTHGKENIRLAAFARRKSQSSHHRELGLDVPATYFSHDFDDDYYWQFETALPAELLTLGKPYDLDFPILNLPLSSDARNWDSDDWLRFFDDRFKSVHELTTHSQRDRSILSFTIIEPFRANPLSGATETHSKVRCYVDRSQGVVRIVPMCVSSIPEKQLASQVKFSHTGIQELWSTMVTRCLVGEPFAFEPQFQLLTFLRSLDYAEPSFRRFRPLLAATPRWTSVTFVCFSEPLWPGRSNLRSTTSLTKDSANPSPVVPTGAAHLSQRKLPLCRSSSTCFVLTVMKPRLRSPPSAG
jgi:hypothetical protein